MRGGELILWWDWVVEKPSLKWDALCSMCRYMLFHETPVQESFRTAAGPVSHLVFQDGR